MNRLIGVVVTVSALLVGGLISAAEPGAPAAVLSLEERGRSEAILIRIAVGDRTHYETWMRSFDAIFEFADADSSGVIEEREARFLPSARGIRLSIGTGFVPPIDPIRSVCRDILHGDSAPCNREALRRYYLRDGLGLLVIGHGPLPHTSALTTVLVRSLDANVDGCLSEQEVHEAETILERFDENDDDLVGAGELVKDITYPGRAADRVLTASSSVDLSADQDGSLVLRRLSEEASDGPSSSEAPRRGKPRTCSEIDASATTCRLTIGTGGIFHGDVWFVRGRLPEQLARLTSGLEGQQAEEMVMTTGDGDRPPERPWLKAVADRNGDGTVEADEVAAWLALQRQIMMGHMLVSIHSGGGLFEVLDRNHDAALSVRELREAWRVLDTAGCMADGRVNPTSMPGQILVVVSHGYPVSLAKEIAIPVEWFGHMDRNGDGDVSRREFSGPLAVFQKLDEDQDGLVSPTEAMKRP